MVKGIVKIKCVSGLNCNPHADLWVCKDLAHSLLALIRELTKIHMNDWGTLATKARREQERARSHSNVKDEEMSVEIPSESTPPP
jgi:hypothetical protein